MSIPILPFDRLKVITMTIVTVLNVNDFNLPAIFALLPTTNLSFAPGQHLQRKQGKVKFSPEMNVPGEILSMRYNKHVRGIIRSLETKSFPHTIIMDLGTPARIISVKLARTIELTGPPSFEIARLAVGFIIDHIRRTQVKLERIQSNPEIAYRMAVKMVEEVVNYTKPLLNRSFFLQNMSEDPIEKEIREILSNWVHDYPTEQLSGFLNFILQLQTPLYTGKLECGPFESEMINVACELGFPINRITMAEVMNVAPFSTSYNNARNCRTVKIRYRYIKMDRTTGKPKESRHTITVNLSGYVTHSGPTFESMEKVYYSFMKMVLENLPAIQSTAPPAPRKIKYNRKYQTLSVDDYTNLIRSEEELRQKILEGRVPLIDTLEDVVEVTPEEAPQPIVQLQIISEQITKIETVEDQKELEISFDYQPILSGMGRS